MFERFRGIIDLASVIAGVSALSGVLGYTAGKLVSGAPDAPLWLQASTSLCILVLAGVQVWTTLRKGSRATP